MRSLLLVAILVLAASLLLPSALAQPSLDDFGSDAASRMETSGQPAVIEDISTAVVRTQAVEEESADFGSEAGVSKTEAAPKPGVVKNSSLSLTEGATVWCWAGDWWVQWHRRSLAGVSVWKYRLTVDDFCWTGTKIVDLNSHRSVSIGVPLWDFCCHLEETKNWNAKWSFRRWTEGKFVWLGPVGVAVRTPEVWFKVRGDGWYDYGAKGD